MNGGNLLAALDARIDLTSVMWLLPVVFMFHDFEEILKVENWLARRRETVLGKMPAFARRLFADSFRMNTKQFAQDVLWVYTTIVVVTAAAVFFEFYAPFLAVLAIFFLHVFTHVGQAILLRMYTPGVTTSVLLVLPYSLYAYYRLIGGGTIGRDDVARSLVLAALLLPPLLWLLLKGRSKAVRRT